MNYDSQKAHMCLTQAAIAVCIGNTGEAIALAKDAITLMEHSLPPPVVTYHGEIVEARPFEKDRD